MTGIPPKIEQSHVRNKFLELNLYTAAFYVPYPLRGSSFARFNWEECRSRHTACDAMRTRHKLCRFHFIPAQPFSTSSFLHFSYQLERRTRSVSLTSLSICAATICVPPRTVTLMLFVECIISTNTPALVYYALGLTLHLSSLVRTAYL